MPYIPEEDRHDMTHYINLLSIQIITPGELNYVVSRLLHKAVESDSRNYENMSRYRAALLDAAEEYYRRVMAPYEDEKRRENGDVYK